MRVQTGDIDRKPIAVISGLGMHDQDGHYLIRRLPSLGGEYASLWWIALSTNDLRLKDGAGRDLAAHLAVRTKGPGIAMSGYSEEELIWESPGAGSADCLAKPVEEKGLLECDARLLNTAD